MSVTRVSGERDRGGPTRLALAGDLTIYTASETKAELALLAADCDALEIDASALEEIDTAGLQLLLLLSREMAGRGGELHLRDPSQPVRAALDILALDDRLRPASAAEM